MKPEVIAAICAVVLVITRYLAALKPLWNLLPARLQWVPPALLASLSLFLAQLPKSPDLATFGEVVLITVVVPLVLAFMAGASAPAHAPKVEPAAPPTTVAIVVLGAFLSTGCVASFEEAKLGNPNFARSLSAANITGPSQRCIDLDNARRTWGAIAAGAGVVTGVGGISTIPVEDQGARIGIAAGAVAAAVLAGVSLAEVEGIGATWIRECSQPGNEVAR
jgi:hypothetical protein